MDNNKSNKRNKKLEWRKIVFSHIKKQSKPNEKEFTPNRKRLKIRHQKIIVNHTRVGDDNQQLRQ